MNQDNVTNMTEKDQSPLRWDILHIEAMDCPTEERLIRQAFQSVAEVQQLQFNLLQRQLRIQHSFASTAPLEGAIAELGMRAVPVQNKQPAAAERKPWWPLALSGVLALAAEICAELSAVPGLAAMLLALGAILLAGLPTYYKGWIAIKNRNLNINALMSIAVTGALFIGHWPEAAMVCVLFALAERIEAASLNRARNAISTLMQLAPDTTSMRLEDGQWQDRPVTEIPLGATLRVLPGQRIALDGTVSEGYSAVDQAPITGESIPVEKRCGDEVFAGTINLSGKFEYQTTRTADDSTLARIIRTVEQAQSQRAPTERFIDRFSSYYTPAICLIALITALIPPLVLGGAWIDWFYRALVLLVIACPCALIISTPVTIVTGLTVAARLGILIKGGAFLEQGRLIDWIGLDKTGTLTRGKPQLTDSLLLSENRPDIHRIAASLAHASTHPVSRAIAEGYQGQQQGFLPVQDFADLPGMGTAATVAGIRYHLGSHRLVEKQGLCSPALEARIEPFEQQGKSVVVLFSTMGPLSLYAVADTLKPSTPQAVASLQNLGVHITMLTGDNPHTAAAIGHQAGIDDIQAGLLPEQKQQIVEKVTQDGQVTAMVGDGINDMAALASARVSFAMGAAGSDSAIETADVALMDDDLRKLPQFIQLARRTHRILLQNISLALSIKILFLLLTLLGEATLWMAVFADMGTSLIVVFNGLRLLRFKAAGQDSAPVKESDCGNKHCCGGH